jgi:RNA polymerase sigma-70 factor (ECF subfamily)
MAAPLDPDAEAMLRVQRGDAAAFEPLVDKYRQPVLSLVYRIVGNASDAEDLAQQAFVQAFRAAARYRVTARFSTWLFTIARNLCLNELRRRSRHPTEPLDAPLGPEGVSRPEPAAHATGAAEALLHDELLNHLDAVLAALPENQRTAILLFQREEMSYEEIANVLGCSLSATKSLIHRGRETLKQRLKPYLESGAWTEPAHATSKRGETDRNFGAGPGLKD